MIDIYISRLTVVSREAKEEVTTTNTREHFTRTNLVKIKIALLMSLERSHFITPDNKCSW